MYKLRKTKHSEENIRFTYFFYRYLHMDDLQGQLKKVNGYPAILCHTQYLYPTSETKEIMLCIFGLELYT